MEETTEVKRNQHTRFITFDHINQCVTTPSSALKHNLKINSKLDSSG